MRADVLSWFHLAVEEWHHPRPPQPHVYGSLGPYIDYMIPLPDFPDAGFRFMFHPFQKTGQVSPEVFVLLIPWRWQAFVGGYRPDYYERDAYPQYPQSEFWTNSLGFRDEEISIPKPPGIYRIVCIGGSTTVEGPRNDLTYPKILQRLLQLLQHNRDEKSLTAGLTVVPYAARFSAMMNARHSSPTWLSTTTMSSDTGASQNTVLKEHGAAY